MSSLEHGETKGNARRPSNEPGSLAPTLLLTWLCSLGSAVSTTGVYFVAHARFGFTETENFRLALLYGITYIVGAASSGWVVRRFAGPGSPWTPRRLLVAVMLILAAACVLPKAIEASWALLAFVGVYSALSGWQWPLIESYIASGRSGHGLRRATGRFNISWASAVAAGLWFIAPMMDKAPLWILAGLAVVHLACVPIILRLRERPAAHGEATVEDSVDDRSLARRLLITFRLLLVTSFVLYSALTPQLPERLTVLGVAPAWQTPLTSLWMISRLGLFALMERWHGWHGRWRTVIWSACALFTGFALAMFALNLTMLIAGLVLFGIGFGGSYSAALYYAMLVGASDIDAGGKHEAIIGVGYSLGPAGMLILHAASARGN